MDGSLLRTPDTPENRAAFGSVGTADDSAAWPAVRLFPLSNCYTRSLLGMPWGPAGTDKAAAEQGLLDTVLARFPRVLTKNQVWLLDRLWHGVRRIAALIGRTHVLIRVKSDVVLKRTSEILPDGSYLAEISGNGVTIAVRVIEYFIDVDGQEVKEMFCLITDLLDWREYPARELAGLYKWRWDGSETGLREAKAPLHGAGPGTGAMLRSGSPDLIAQEIAAWAAGHRDDPRRHPRRRPDRAARRKGRRAGQPVRSRDLSLTRAAAASSSPRSAPDGLQGPDRPDRRMSPPPTGTGTAPVSPSPPAPSPRRAEGHGYPHRPGRHHPRQRARSATGNPATPR